MDESSFDDLIKSKLDNYEDPTLDEGAFVRFEETLLASQPMPWYNHNLSRLGLAASAIIVTLLNIYILTLYKSKNKVTVLSSKSIAETRKMDSLTTIINQFRLRENKLIKAEENNRVTIKEREAELSQVVKQNSLLQQRLTEVHSQPNKIIENSYPSDPSSIVSIGKASDLPANLVRLLREQNLAIVDDRNDQVYLFASYRLHQVLRQAQQLNSHLTPISLFVINEVQPFNADNLKIQAPATLVKGVKKLMSLKQRNELEKHYFSGIGINIGGHLDFLQSSFSSGSGSFNPRIGVLADWVVSPRLSIETGFDYFTNSIAFEKDIERIYLPRQTDQFGPLQTARIDNYLLSTPLSIKYRQWVGEKTQSIFKLGYSPYYSFSSKYNYSYPFSKPQHPNDPDDPAYKSPRINTVEESTLKGYYGASLTGSIGLSRVIKKKNVFEASLFYEKSLGTMGQQGLKMNLIGLRTAYLFNMK
jgi:hypothetical protein